MGVIVAGRAGAVKERTAIGPISLSACSDRDLIPEKSVKDPGAGRPTPDRS
jgi:hypothetical protein